MQVPSEPPATAKAASDPGSLPPLPEAVATPAPVTPRDEDPTLPDGVPLPAGAAVAATPSEPLPLPPPPEPPPATYPVDEDGVPVVRAAGWLARAGAATVDLAVCFALSMGYAMVEVLDLPAEPTESAVPLAGVDRALDVAARYSGLLLGMLVALALATALYESLSVALMGRTAGQKLMGIRLMHRSGVKPGVGRALMRGFIAGAGLLVLGAGWLWAPFDRRRMGAHDRFTGLYTVEDPPAAPLPQQSSELPPSSPGPDDPPVPPPLAGDGAPAA